LAVVSSPLRFASYSLTTSICSNRRLELDECSQLFIRARNETLSIIAVGVDNPERLPIAIHRCKTTPNSFRPY
jgi:hypothetical protein